MSESQISQPAEAIAKLSTLTVPAAQGEGNAKAAEGVPATLNEGSSSKTEGDKSARDGEYGPHIDCNILLSKACKD